VANRDLFMAASFTETGEGRHQPGGRWVESEASGEVPGCWRKPTEVVFACCPPKRKIIEFWMLGRYLHEILSF